MTMALMMIAIAAVMFCFVFGPDVIRSLRR